MKRRGNRRQVIRMLQRDRTGTVLDKSGPDRGEAEFGKSKSVVLVGFLAKGHKPESRDLKYSKVAMQEHMDIKKAVRS